MLQTFIRTASLEALEALSGWLNVLMVEGSDPTSNDIPYSVNWDRFNQNISLHSHRDDSTELS